MNTDDLITKLTALEQKRIDSVKAQKDKLQAKRDAWGKVQDALSDLRLKLDSLRFQGPYYARTATVSDSTVADATAGSSTPMIPHTLEVLTLAQTHITNSQLFNSANSPLLSGGATSATLNIQVGAGAAIPISVGANDTLYSLRDAINKNAGSVVTAEVVSVNTTGTPQYKLVLTSKTQGTAGKITLTDDGSSGLLATLSMSDLTPAQDATFKVDGSAVITRSTNVITDVIPGVTFTLKKANPGTPVTITIGQDTDAVVKAIQDWASSMNNALSLLKDLTKYDKTGVNTGVLNGDSLARSLQTTLRSSLSTLVSVQPGDPASLAEVGITTGQYGTADFGKVLVNADKLKAQLLSNPDGVARLFGVLRTNVALSGSVTVSSTASGTYSPQDIINGDSDPSRFGSQGGGWQSANVPSAGSPESVQIDLAQTETIDQIRLYMPDANTTLQNFTVSYLDINNNWQTLQTVTNNTAMFKQLDFNPVQAKAIKLDVTATLGNSPAKLSELEVNRYTSGLVANQYSFVNQSLRSSDGYITTVEDNLDKQSKALDDKIAQLTDTMNAHADKLRAQFVAMEQNIANLRAQGASLLGMLGQAPSGSSGG